MATPCNIQQKKYSHTVEFVLHMAATTVTATLIYLSFAFQKILRGNYLTFSIIAHLKLYKPIPILNTEILKEIKLIL